MLAEAAKELDMEARDGIRTDGSRRSGVATDRRRSSLGMSLDLDAPRRNARASLSARSTDGGVRSSWDHDIMASGPQALVLAAAPGRRKGVHAGYVSGKLRQEDKEDHELRSVCEAIGLKAAQKFSTVRQAFRYLDADHDGKISRSEMQYFFRAYNFAGDTADRFFNKLDHDNSGEVEYAEFMKYVAPYVQPEAVITCESTNECSSNASTRTPSPTSSTGQPTANSERGVPPDVQSSLTFIGQKAEEKFSHARGVFRCVDCNDDGRISRGEMRYFFRVFNRSEADADKVYEHLANGTSGDVDYYAFVGLLGPFLSLPGTAAAMSQRPEGSRRTSITMSGRSSRTCSARGSLNSICRDSRVPSSADSMDSAFPGKRAEAQELTDAELEKEMRDVMKDIGEKIHLKFRHVRDAFRPLDLSHNGKITLTEMRSFLRGFGWPHDVADRLFKALDHDACGEIDFNAFVAHFDAVLGPANRLASRTELVTEIDDQLKKEVNQIAGILGEKLLTKFSSAREALRTLDLSNDGKITSGDMRLFFRAMCMPVDAANKMFKCLCKDGEDAVDYNDFLTLFGPVDGPGGRWRSVQELKGSPRPAIWTIM
jgi:Ca2+-binding EF-hand superfamily protein